MVTFDHKALAKKWRERWEKEGTYDVDLEKAKNPYYNLMMFPYPSAEGMHMGSMRTFAGIDAHGRFQRLKGHDVFQPIGLDGFGIHAENYAIKIDSHPVEQAKVTRARYYEQFRLIGNGYPWDHSLETYNPDYYRWTQWLFIQMYKNGLAERKESYVNWCPSCKTVLADEQVINGNCERCDSETTKKKTEQWFFKITEYAQQLLDNIDKIDWPYGIEQSQRNWIGRKEGVNITYDIVSTDLTVTCFTTRPDTNFGATFVVLGPEHPLLQNGELKMENEEEVREYIEEAKRKTEMERVAEGTTKTGVFTGYYAKNPLNGRDMPIYVSDFVLGHVGTGAVVGVPGHDRRDFDFACVFNLPVIQVVKRVNPPVLRSYLMGGDIISDNEIEDLGVQIIETAESGSRKLEIPDKAYEAYQQLVKEKLSEGYWNEVLGEDIWFLFKDKDGNTKEYILNDSNKDEIATLCSEYNGDPIDITSNMYLYLGSNDWYTDYLVNEEEGVMINSDFLNGIEIHEAIRKMMDYLEEKGWGERTVSWHLRDWLISRQRYWGPPIPMIFCESCGWSTVPENQLPVELPYIEDYRPTGDGKSPLEKAPEEWLYTDCPECGNRAKRETDVSDTFLDSSWYFLAYPNLQAKEWDSTVTPFNDEITTKWLPVDAYIGGAEHAVLHLLYSRFVTMALHDWGFLHFSDIGEPFPYLIANGLILKDGAKMSKSKGNVIVPDGYVEKYGADAVRMYLAFTGPFESDGDFKDEGMEAMSKFVQRIWSLYQDENKLAAKTSPELLKQLHKSIRRVEKDILRFKYNTAISAIMEVVNVWKTEGEVFSKEDASAFLQIFSPFAPFMTEELWEKFGNEGSIHHSTWPSFDPGLAKGDEVTIVIQVNGKVRGSLELERNDEPWSEEDIVTQAKEIESVRKYLTGDVKKTIYIEDKLVNFVV